jgi:hypothetical protein
MWSARPSARRRELEGIGKSCLSRIVRPVSTRIVLSLEAAAEAAWRVADFVTATKRKEQP